MKMKKLFLLCMLFLCLLSFNEASAAVRVGVFVIQVSEDGATLDVKNLSDYRKYNAVQEKYRTIFMNLLSKTEGLDVIDLGLEKNQKLFQQNPKIMEKMALLFTMSRWDTAAYYKELGRMTKTRYLITGALNFHRPSIKEVTAEASFMLIDTANGEVVQDFKGLGGIKLSSTGKTSKQTKNDSVEEQVAVYAMSQVVEQSERYISGKGSLITDIEDSRIIINKGASSGVKAGDIYKVQADKLEGIEDIFTSDTELSGLIDVALLKIIDTQKTTSTAEVITDAGFINAIRTGDKLMPVSSYEVDKILYEILSGSRPAFPDKRKESQRTALTGQTVINTAADFEQQQKFPSDVIRIGVIKFDSKADNILDRDAEAATDLFMRFLSNSDKIAVIERDRLESIAREHKLNLSGMISPETASILGKLAGCQYILSGAITAAQEDESQSGVLIEPYERQIQNSNPNIYKTKAGKVLAGIALLSDVLDLLGDSTEEDNVVSEAYEMTIDIDVRLIKVETGEIEIALTEEGSARQVNTITQDKKGYTKSIEINYGGLQNKAIASAASNLSNRLIGRLTGEYAHVAAVNGDEIIINRGSLSGIQTGDLFCLYPEKSSVLYTDAIISVTDVQDLFSSAKLIFKSSSYYIPDPGERLEAVSYSDFQKGILYIKDKKREQIYGISANIKDNAAADKNSSSKSNKKLEISSTDPKKVIRSYGLNAKEEKALIEAHSKASKMSGAKKKYETYSKLANDGINDYLAAYNAGKSAFDLKLYDQAKDLTEKALSINPYYKPAKILMRKINRVK